MCCPQGSASLSVTWLYQQGKTQVVMVGTTDGKVRVELLMSLRECILQSQTRQDLRSEVQSNRNSSGFTKTTLDVLTFYFAVVGKGDEWEHGLTHPPV